MTTTKPDAFEISGYMAELSATIEKLPLSDIGRIVHLFFTAYRDGRTIFLLGNGGSAVLASHMACDLGKGTASASGRRLRAVALTDNVALITAWANDTNYEKIFAEQLENLLDPGDVVFAISGSGNSPNVLAALDFARRAGAVTGGLTGFNGGRMKPLCHVCAVVPSGNMQIIEDLHLSIAHSVFRALVHQIEQTGRHRGGIALSSSASIASRAASAGNG
ncbi:MAG: SIS domain-containing protein [Candidatus Sulfotelmatobacter sp.]